MSDELHVVSLVTLFNAVHADGVAVCGVTGVAPVGNQRTTALVTRKQLVPGQETRAKTT